MSQSSAMNSGPTEEKHGGQDSVVKLEVTVKEEPLECVVCGVKTRECLDMFTTRTPSGASLHHFIAKYTQVDLAFTDSCSKQSCKSCYDLINVLERTELEYVKLKEAFEAILSKNPLFELSVVPAPIGLSDVKQEQDAPEDSEDEPLSRRKTTRHTKTVKKKKKVTGKPKRKKSIERISWECDECGVVGEDGGTIALAAHKITVHTEIAPVKLEDGSQSPFNNGNDDLLEVAFGHFDDDDDDEDSNFNPEEFNDSNDVNKKKAKKKPTERKKPKEMHPCDQCNSRYSSLARLEAHKMKHDGSKPPYICEVCGAHYKHKRACDIHIALHKGISDWKCEECNKLFPSKNALQRHNNIHTGKLNYQCDLCGKSFIHTSSFKMHKLSHSGVKPHSCRVCGLALMTRSHLKRHERIHSGEKRHECTACGKRFSERYNLAAHMKSHETATPPPEQRRRPMFRCQFCTERFERRYMLERHMSTVHGRTLERPPPTPRNTMSKLLKQRAQRPATQDPPQQNKSSPEPERTPPVTNSATLPSSKLLAQLTSSASIITTGSWSGAYAAEFGLRHDYPH